MFEAKAKCEAAFERYLALPVEEREDAIWLVRNIETAMKGLGIPDDQTAVMYFVLYRLKVLMPFQQMHSNPDVFGQNAAQFDPRRFLNNPSLTKSTSYHPFGTGLTYCPGIDDSISSGGVMGPRKGDDLIVQVSLRKDSMH
ncbi:cytochrome P450 protein [Rutstroemia sp. NJR-2017a BVV2]|nr:cytochrome P450 protein [Rutstroemia sp. NJR-2017a BVV2]